MSESGIFSAVLIDVNIAGSSKTMPKPRHDERAVRPLPVGCASIFEVVFMEHIRYKATRLRHGVDGDLRLGAPSGLQPRSCVVVEHLALQVGFGMRNAIEAVQYLHVLVAHHSPRCDGCSSDHSRPSVRAYPARARLLFVERGSRPRAS